MIDVELYAHPAPPEAPEERGDRIRRSKDRSRTAVVLLPLRLFLAAGWLRAAAEKIIDPTWWRGEKLREFLVVQHDVALPFFRPVMDGVISPLAAEVAAVVAVTQLVIGVAIGLGRPLKPALTIGVVLNVVFVLAGRVNPSAFYLVMEAALLYAISAGILGDRRATPTSRSLLVAVGWLSLALAMTPFVRTLEPARVIEDPAMMLVFLGVVMAVTTVIRWIEHHDGRYEALVTVDLQALRTWVICRRDDAGDVDVQPGLAPPAMAEPPRVGSPIDVDRTVGSTIGRGSRPA